MQINIPNDISANQHQMSNQIPNTKPQMQPKKPENYAQIPNNTNYVPPSSYQPPPKQVQLPPNLNPNPPEPTYPSTINLKQQAFNNQDSYIPRQTTEEPESRLINNNNAEMNNINSNGNALAKVRRNSKLVQGDRPNMGSQQLSIDHFDHYKRPPSRDSSVDRLVLLFFFFASYFDSL